MAIRSASLLLLLVILAAPARPAAAQSDERFTLVARGAPLNEALEELVRLTEIDLIYSSALAEGKTAFCDGRELPAEDLLRCILADSGLDFVRTSAGTYVVVDARREKAIYGDVAGRIIDRETGDPLPYANVLLADASVGTTTNESGFFHFASVISGVHRLLVTYVGYETRIDSIRVAGGETHTAEIALNPHPVALEPVIIDGLVERLPSRTLGSGAVEAGGLREISSMGTPDVARAVAAVAGVAIRHPLADLHIQGSGAGEHLTLLDGVPVRDPVTLGRHLSAFSPLALRRVTVHKAGFGAAHGGHLSGVVRIEHDVTAPDGQHVAAHLDPISFSGKMQGRMQVSSRVAAHGMASVRTGLWNAYRDPGLEALLDRWNTVDPILAGIWIQEPVSRESIVARLHRPDVAFSDLHGAVRLDLGALRTLDVSGYRASNRLATELVAVNADPTDEQDRMLLTRDEYDWSNWAGQLRHTWLVNARTAASLQARASLHSSTYGYLSAQEAVPNGMTDEEIDARADGLDAELYGFVGSDEENVMQELAAEATVNRSLTSRGQVDLSLEALLVESRFRLANQFIAPFRHETNTWHLTAYAQGEWSLGLDAVLEPGLRLTYVPDRQSVYAEPRLAVRFDRSGSAIGPVALRVAGGLYRQYIPSYSLTSSGSTSVVPYMRFWLPIDRTHAPPKSYHLSSEALFTPAGPWTAALETFYKWQPRLLMVDYARLLSEHPSIRPRPDPVSMPQSDFIASGSGRAYGASARISFNDERLTTSAQYAYTFAERRISNRFGGELRSVPWNEPHRLTGSVRYRLTSGLSIFADGEASWGRSWALRWAYYDYLALRDAPAAFPPFDLDDPSRQTLPSYRRISAGAAFNVDLNRFSVEVRAAVVNLLDRENAYDWSLEPSGGSFSPVARTLPGRRPSVSVRLAY